MAAEEEPDSNARFSAPRLAINRVYTRRGDSGRTTLAGNIPIDKDDLRLEAYGTVDELNVFIGSARVSIRRAGAGQESLKRLDLILGRVQHELFNLGAILATHPDRVSLKQPRIEDENVERLEQEIDEMNSPLPELRSFVLPGGSASAVDLHKCRVICRRAERLCVRLSRREEVPALALRYLNRLSDALFVWSRWVDWVLDSAEMLWDPNFAKVFSPTR